MSETEWKAKYVSRFLKGPWSEGDMTEDHGMQTTAKYLADKAWKDDPAADPDEAACDEMDGWREG